jgi:hypothetical protein
VETPEDALDCFLATGMDALFLDDLLVLRRPLQAAKGVAPAVLHWRLETRRPFDLVRRSMPGGRVELRLETRCPRAASLDDVGPDLARALEYVDSPLNVGSICGRLSMNPGSARAGALARGLLGMRSKGMIRFVAGES